MPTKSKLIDVSILSIFLVESHPGHAYVDPVVSDGLEGSYRLLIPAHLPLRARWVLTTQWGVPKSDADRAIEDFLAHRRVRYVAPTRATYQSAYHLAVSLHHDVYDAFFLALARDHGASTLITTDTDFRNLCGKAGIEYENPVPAHVLGQFGAGPRG